MPNSVPEWVRVVIEAPREDVEEVAAFMAELSGAGVEIESSSPDARPGRERMAAYLPNDDGLPSRVGELNSFLEARRRENPGGAPVLVRSETVPEEDWQQNWKKHFRAGRITPRLIVRPPWDEYLPIPGDRVIEIDPGMAFGTGLHATTRLLLGFIDELYTPTKGTDLFFPVTALDVGTGTGILAMACALLGARETVALDNDSRAVSAARANVRKNGLAGSITVTEDDLSAVPGPFDLITANITHDTLHALAPAVVDRLAAPGTLLLAGILKGGQEESLARRYGDLGLELLDSRCRDEWAALKFARPFPQARPRQVE